ncbi:MAG: iron dicitrate transport regulator FecR [Ilumatobacteraceae bacterium]|nr:iron dicitrate transport regulator FecR [Ilumatobacteraceae bacterium]
MSAQLFLADLERKPEVLHRLADSIAAGAFAWPVDPSPATVTMIGMGSSLYAAQVVARRLRAGGVIAVAESGSAEIAFPSAEHDLVVGISAGGTSIETNRLFAASAAGRRVALTNVAGSAITSNATAVIEMLAEPELGGVACRSYVHTLVALLALERELLGDESELAGIVRRAAAATQALLDGRDDWLQPTTDLLAGPDGTWTLAPLERQSSAMQSALMLREGPRRAAVGCETGDWSHVDVYLTKTLDYRALVFTGSRWDDQAVDWLTRRGSTFVAVGGELAGAARSVRYPGDDDPVVALLTETTVAELVAATLWARSADR